MEKAIIKNVTTTLCEYDRLYDISVEFDWDYVSASDKDKKFYIVEVKAYADCERIEDGFNYTFGNEEGFYADDIYIDGYIGLEDLTAVIETIQNTVISETNGNATAYDFTCEMNGDSKENLLTSI